MTVIIITHNSALTPMADRIIRIRNGKVSSMEINQKPVPVEDIAVVAGVIFCIWKLRRGKLL